jgi:hypothetical protein
MTYIIKGNLRGLRQRKVEEKEDVWFGVNNRLAAARRGLTSRAAELRPIPGDSQGLRLPESVPLHLLFFRILNEFLLEFESRLLFQSSMVSIQACKRPNNKKFLA